MTKEELKQEAEEWLCNNLHSASEEDFIKAMVDIAEPREKRIEELIALINAERERQEKCDDIHLRTIATLEKENAELKKELEEADNATDCFNRQEEIIAKAKQFIRDFLSVAVDYIVPIDKNYSLIAEAEQFLKENA